MKVWHEDDEFWESFAPKIFAKDLWDNAQVEVEKIISLLKINPGACVLDLCCGTGRHSLELARQGFQVIGVDRTLSYIKEAKKRATAENLKIKFVQEDMRTYLSPETFDAVINFYTSFGYFENPEENKQVLNNVYLSLKPGGKLLIDVIGREVFARIISFRQREWFEANGVFYLQESKPIENWEKIENRWIRFKDNEKKEIIVIHRLYSETELSSLLFEADFRTVDLFGELNGSPYDHTARRLIALAIK